MSVADTPTGDQPHHRYQALRTALMFGRLSLDQSELLRTILVNLYMAADLLRSAPSGDATCALFVTEQLVEVFRRELADLPDSAPPSSGARYDGPRPGGLALVHGPLVRVEELAARDGVAGAVVTADGATAWVPIAWLVHVPTPR